MAKQSAPASQPATESAANRPVQTLRHRSLKATVWRNQTDSGVMYNVTIVRSYRDKDTEDWHDTHSFGYDDLMNVAKLMYDAHSVISSLRAKENASARNTKSGGPVAPDDHKR